MSDDLAVVGSDTLSTASVRSSGSNVLSDVLKQLPQSTVDAWNAAFNAAKAKGSSGVAEPLASGGRVAEQRAARRIKLRLAPGRHL
jgi:hypothetical protein